jgi:Na+/melibiose symporter-like transporter
LKIILADRDKSAILILFAIFAWFVGFNVIETFFTLYGVNVLGVKESAASLTLGFLSVTFVLFAVPSGFIATKFGRKPTILVGLASLAILLAIVRVLPPATQTVSLGAGITVLHVLMMVAGIAWALINTSYAQFVYRRVSFAKFPRLFLRSRMLDGNVLA